MITIWFLLLQKRLSKLFETILHNSLSDPLMMTNQIPSTKVNGRLNDVQKNSRNYVKLNVDIYWNYVQKKKNRELCQNRTSCQSQEFMPQVVRGFVYFIFIFMKLNFIQKYLHLTFHLCWWWGRIILHLFSSSDMP